MEGTGKSRETYENKDTKIAINTVEHAIQEVLPVSLLVDIFGPETYLIGGAIRDLILGKNISSKDFDLMTRASPEEVLGRLKLAGFSEAQGVKFGDKQYSMKEGTGVINLLLDGREIQVGFKGNQSIESLINSGDVNLNCCTFSLGSQKIINPDIFEEILEHRLLFCNSELAKNDPMKIVSALKIISRMPEIQVDEETENIIMQSLPKLVDFFSENPDRRHKLAQLFGNITSGEVVKLFSSVDTHGLLEGLEAPRVKLRTSERYISSFVDELSDGVKQKLKMLIKEKFGTRLEEDKLFNTKVKSVVYRLDEQENAVACCLLDSRRIYLASASDSSEMVNIVADLCEHNAGIWTTISLNRNLLFSLSLKAGLQPVTDPSVLRKILISNYPEYENRIVTETIRGRLVFTKSGSNDAPQMLFIS
ncbi:MAG: hypothetical protein PHD04_01115 [Candidatus Pacebacteria bacterium]|nr:hypothetical protein [Candidatus Paceibacterota bacterium]